MCKQAEAAKTPQESGYCPEVPHKVERYGTETFEISDMDTLRRIHCMCHNCGRIDIPSQTGRCDIATELYKLCKEHGMAMLVTRCKEWIPRQ